MDKKIMQLLSQWHEEGKYHEIIEEIEKIPAVDRSYDLTGQLARAYNNLHTKEGYQKAAALLESVMDEGKNDALLHYRLGFSYYYMDRDAEALHEFERADELEPGDPDTLDFIEICKDELRARTGSVGPELYSDEELRIVEDHITRYFGEFETVYHELSSPDIHVDICVIPPGPRHDYYVLATMGMGAHRMEIPEEYASRKLERAELLLCLPSDWQLSDPDEKWYWPIRWLKQLARLPIEEDAWLGWGHTVTNRGPFAGGTELCGVILTEPQGFSEASVCCRLPDGDDVNFYQIIPLYQEEMQFKIQYGAEALLHRMTPASLRVINIRRANFCGGFSPAQYRPSRIARRTVEFLSCPCRIYGPSEDDSTLLEAYQEAWARGRREGFTPVLVTPDEGLLTTLILNSDPGSEESNGAEYDPDAVEDYREAMCNLYLTEGHEYFESLMDLRRHENGRLPMEISAAQVIGGEEVRVPESYWDFDRNTTYETILAEIPTESPWEIFAWLPMGAWNDCPDTMELMSAAKYWYEEYGAVPCALSRDELEFRLEHPVEDKEEAARLAAEQYAFCPERVEDCEKRRSVGVLADSLTKSKIWYFWWG